MIHAYRSRPARLLVAALCAAGTLTPALAQAETATQLQEVTVTGTREGELKAETPASISIIKGDTIDAVKPAHPSEIMSRVPGAVIMQTNGEGHTTGLRQPIGTAAVYSYLEDGIPTRATGFFNHNALFEVNLPQADGLEVTRGPGSALQGSDAIGGVFNVLTKPPSDKPEATMTLEGGSYGWARFLGSASESWGDVGARGDVNLTHSDGWRQRTEYDRRTGAVRVDSGLGGGAALKTIVSATDVDMQTGANARLTKTDYDNSPETNYHSIAYRRLKAFRASTAYEQEDQDSLFSLTPFVRANRMELLASFTLSSDPTISTTGHQSLGMMAKYRKDFAPWRTRIVTGMDLDYSPGTHEEDRLKVVKSGEYYTGYTNLGRIYDYDVTYMQASPYLHAETSPISPLRISAGLRADVMRYDYENHLSSGAFSTLTPTGTKTYYRPGDTTRDYSHLSPSLGATYAFDPALNGFVRYKHSFRAPSESDLFRSGQNADSIHLRPVKVDNYEAGLRGPDTGPVTWELAYFTMLKRDDILTVKDSSGANMSSNNGKTRHYGVEGALGWQFLPEWKVGAVGSYARHRYASWVTSTANFSGMDIAAAPRVVTSMTLGWAPKSELLSGLKLEAEWSHLGPYEMDDANLHRYDGHDLFNLRGSYALTENLEVFGRVMNLLDAQWATIAAIGSSREEFAPGAPRTVFAGITARF
ncbi:MAG: TonB-dependent receptor [Magnetospirillum sp.]|nr:TonB-dependent receptor [Magnetospirillum sp.]